METSIFTSKLIERDQREAEYEEIAEEMIEDVKSCGKIMSRAMMEALQTIRRALQVKLSLFSLQCTNKSHNTFPTGKNEPRDKTRPIYGPRKTRDLVVFLLGLISEVFCFNANTYIRKYCHHSYFSWGCCGRFGNVEYCARIYNLSPQSFNTVYSFLIELS